jgi:ferric-dicitrate binding protein FerR (iron transport regulator)
MRARRVASAAAVVGSLGAVLLLRRRSSGSRERIDVYLADGSRLTHDAGSAAFARLAPLAQDVLRAAAS